MRGEGETKKINLILWLEGFGCGLGIGLVIGTILFFL